jgi:CheY-like chemotaxis protein
LYIFRQKYLRRNDARQQPVLIVEDQPAVRKVIGRMLSRRGFALLEAADAAAARRSTLRWGLNRRAQTA